MESRFQEVLVVAAEGANGVVVGVVVGAEVTHRHRVVSEGFDAAAGEGAGGVGIDEQGEHEGGRVLLGAGAALVDLGGGEVEDVHRLDDEIDDVGFGDPVAQVNGKQERCAAVDVDESMFNNLFL